MTIASALTALNQDVQDARTAITTKGGTVTVGGGSSQLATDIATIPEGVGSTITALNITGNSINAGDKVWIKGPVYSYNFNVVGFPTINYEDNSIYNFSPKDYLQLQTPFNPTVNPWEIVGKITTGSSSNVNYKIFQSCKGTGEAGRYGFLIYIDSNNTFRFALSSNGSSWMFDQNGINTIQVNTDYWIKCGWTGTEYYLEYSLDGENYNRDITYSSQTPVYHTLANTYIGIYSTTDFRDPFKGILYLSETKFYIGGVLWWSPSITPLANHSLIDINKIRLGFEVNGNIKEVGSTTHYTQFVFGGFSSSNYLLGSAYTIEGFDRSHSTWYYKFKPTGTSNNRSIFEGFIPLQYQTNKLMGYNGNTSSGFQIAPLTTNQNYWLKVVINGNERTFYISTDGYTYTQTYTASNFESSSGNVINISYIGYASWTGAFVGTIDLKGVYVEDVNGKTVWSAVRSLAGISQDILTGFATENIADGSTGVVKTVLGS